MDNMLSLQIHLREKLDELEEKMKIPLPSKELISEINLLNKDLKDRVSFLESSNINISIQKRRYLRILAAMNRGWPFNY